jgi:hypothetical protein
MCRRGACTLATLAVACLAVIAVATHHTTRNPMPTDHQGNMEEQLREVTKLFRDEQGLAYC